MPSLETPLPLRLPLSWSRTLRAKRPAIDPFVDAGNSHVPDKFVVGYGLTAERYRNLLLVGVL